MGELKTGPRGEAGTQAPRTIQIGVRGRHHEGPRPYCPMDSPLSLDGHAQVSDARRNGQIALLHLLGARVDVRTIWVHIIISSARRQEQRQRRHDVRERESAKTQLRQGVDGANKTFKDTDGKVADNATRDSLRKAIDEANAILNKKDVSDPKTYTDEKGKLDTAIKKVNDSKAAKENADAETAAKAQAEAQAQAAAQAQSQSYNRGYSSNRGGNSNSSRGYSAPQQSYAPSDNTNSGSGSHRTFDFSNSGADGGSVGGDPYAPIVH